MSGYDLSTLSSAIYSPKAPAAGTTTTTTPASVANPLGTTTTKTYDGVSFAPVNTTYGTIYQLGDIRGQQARPNLNPIGLPDRRNVWELNRT